MITYIVYTMLWLVSISMSSWTYMWIIMEMMNWWLLFWFVNSSMLSFTIWQSICGMLFLSGWIVFESSSLIVLAIIMKTGLPVFNSWVLSLEWKWESWAIFLTLHKTLPYIILISILNSKLFLLLIMVLVLLTQYSNTNWFSMMWTSSVIDTAWMCLSSSWTQFWLYKILYTFLWISWMYQNKDWNSNYSASSVAQIQFLVQLGLPPLTTFFMKMNILLQMNMTISVCLMIFSWLMVFIYWSWINLFLLKLSLMKYSNNNWPIIVSTIFSLMVML